MRDIDDGGGRALAASGNVRECHLEILSNGDSKKRNARGEGGENASYSGNRRSCKDVSKVFSVGQARIFKCHF